MLPPWMARKRQCLIALLSVIVFPAGIGCYQGKGSIPAADGAVRIDEDKADLGPTCRCYNLGCQGCVSTPWALASIAIVFIGLCGLWACSFTAAGARGNRAAVGALHQNSEVPKPSQTNFSELEPLLGWSMA